MGCLTGYLAIRGEDKTRESLGFDILKRFVLVTLYEADGELLKAEDIRERLGLPKKYHAHDTNDFILNALGSFYYDTEYVERVDSKYVTFNDSTRWRITGKGIKALEKRGIKALKKRQSPDERKFNRLW